MNQEHLTKKALKTRGWTDKAIDLFLKTHDKEAKNPVFRTASPMKLYLIERVEKVEQTKEFQDFQTKNKSKREGSQKAVETKKKNLLNEINNWKIKLEHKDLRVIEKNAIYSYNQFKQERSDESEEGNYDFIPANSKSDRIFLNRIIVNYLRHNLSDYDSKLGDVFGRVGTSEAYRIINEKIYSKIADVYPELKDECDNQLMRKLDETNNMLQVENYY